MPSVLDVQLYRPPMTTSSSGGLLERPSGVTGQRQRPCRAAPDDVDVFQTGTTVDVPDLAHARRRADVLTQLAEGRGTRAPARCDQGEVMRHRPVPDRPENAARSCWTVSKHEPNSINKLRSAVRTALAKWGVDPESDSAFAVRLVTTELTTNALRYGSPILHLVDVMLWTDGAMVTVIVHDSTQAPPMHVQAEPDAERGRGLALVNAYASDHGWQPSEIGTRVWAQVPLAVDVDVERGAIAPASAAVA